MNREQWLTQAVELIRPRFKSETNADLPEEIYVSVGWPSAGGLSSKKRVVGQCWPSETEAPHIYVSPLLDDPAEVLAVLVHELVHSVCAPGTGHRGDFVRHAKEMGLTAPWTQSVAGQDLGVWIDHWLRELPEYPHTPPNAQPTQRKVQATRMLKLVAAECKCAVRTTKKYIEIEGAFKCPHDNVLEVPAE